MHRIFVLGAYAQQRASRGPVAGGRGKQVRVVVVVVLVGGVVVVVVQSNVVIVVGVAIVAVAVVVVVAPLTMRGPLAYLISRILRPSHAI